MKVAISAAAMASMNAKKDINDFLLSAKKYQPHIVRDASTKNVGLKIKWALCRDEDIIKLTADLTGLVEAIDVAVELAGEDVGPIGRRNTAVADQGSSDGRIAFADLERRQIFHEYVKEIFDELGSETELGLAGKVRRHEDTIRDSKTGRRLGSRYDWPNDFINGRRLEMSMTFEQELSEKDGFSVFSDTDRLFIISGLNGNFCLTAEAALDVLVLLLRRSTGVMSLDGRTRAMDRAPNIAQKVETLLGNLSERIRQETMYYDEKCDILYCSRRTTTLASAISLLSFESFVMGESHGLDSILLKETPNSFNIMVLNGV
ncbi:uncharacterized protein PAC_19662 [Phialocephala subalpina]|uniref:Uncharacterized protein n=1 Tax=Phialocephala subalpina TaxID=576137 RepID=A0A1L7XXH6_9HELO|nr:uncharacterized protein PAC_19662 [Phialocephala subalpina]